MTLRDLKVGQSARIKAVGGEGELRQHFLDMGVNRMSRWKVRIPPHPKS